MRRIAWLLLVSVLTAGCSASDTIRDGLFGMFGSNYSGGTTRSDRYSNYTADVAAANSQQ